jgi:hypothetical protein
VDEVAHQAPAFVELDDRDHVGQIRPERRVGCATHDGVREYRPASGQRTPGRAPALDVARARPFLGRRLQEDRVRRAVLRRDRRQRLSALEHTAQQQPLGLAAIGPAGVVVCRPRGEPCDDRFAIVPGLDLLPARRGTVDVLVNARPGIPPCGTSWRRSRTAFSVPMPGTVSHQR